MSVELIEKMIEITLRHEGRYSDHADDSGGKTMWGITEWVARKNGYFGDMKDLPRERAKDIYRNEYATRPGFSAVASICPKAGFELFDTGVNMGPGRPARWLQMLLNAFNQRGKLYADIKEDGDIGPATLNALQKLCDHRGAAEVDEVLTAFLNGYQAVAYVELTRARQKDESFIWGWRKRVLPT